MAKKIVVKLFATLGERYSIPDTCDLTKPRRIAELIDEAGIPPGKVSVLFIDGRHAGTDDSVNPGQTLSLFPAIGGG